MNAEDKASLHDEYELFHKDKPVEQTACIMQFLWWDFTSCYDIVGPYYTSLDDFTAKVIHTCALETIHLFQVSYIKLCHSINVCRYMGSLPAYLYVMEQHPT